MHGHFYWLNILRRQIERSLISRNRFIACTIAAVTSAVDSFGEIPNVYSLCSVTTTCKAEATVCTCTRSLCLLVISGLTV